MPTLFSSKIFVVTAALFLSPITAFAQASDALTDLPGGAYDLDLTHASLTWRVSHMGLSMYTARFTDFDADLTLNTDALEDSALSVVIKADSVETDYPFPDREDWNNVLSTSDKWFNSGAYPEIIFKATQFNVASDKTGTIIGDLTLLGQTHPVTLEVTMNGAMKKHPFRQIAAMGFTASAMIDRTQWGMNTFAPMIGKDVELIIQTEFFKAK